MKKKLLLALTIIGLALVVNSCQRDPDLPDDPQIGQENWQEGVAQAKAFFESIYSPELKTRTALYAPASAFLSSMDVNPDWEHSFFSENDEEFYWEFPLISELRFGHAPPDSEDPDNVMRLMERRLVVRKDRVTGEMQMYTALWIPDDEPSEKIMPGLTMLEKEDFAGRVYLFYPDGQFYQAVRFENGQRKATIVLAEIFETPIQTRGELHLCTTYYEGAWTQTCWYSYNGQEHTLMYCTSWEFDLEWIDIECEDIGEDGGSSGNSSSEPKDKEPTDPCKNMKNKMSNTKFTSMLNELSGLTSANYEAGRAYRYGNSDYAFSTHNGNPGEPWIDWEPSSSANLSGFVHTHYGGLYPIFSASDLLIPGYWNQLGGIYDLKTFSMGLVASQGTYFLQITNLSQYLDFYNSYRDILGTLESIYDVYNIEPNASGAIESFALMLDKLNSGLTLMKKNGNNFNKIKVNPNNSVTENPC